jgi:aspartyl-tRNA(Asn)/glutamyl-tRNA(Gln) amidotransferase subunit B
MRSKEDALDYRYFPEPDLPPIHISNERRERLHKQEITIPHEIIKKMKKEYNFNKEYINALISNKTILDYFNSILHDCEK